MKNLILFLLFTAPIFCSAQHTFKISVVSIETGKPMARKWFTVLKNEDEYVTFTRTDTNGVGTFQINNYDSAATYQVEICKPLDQCH